MIASLRETFPGVDWEKQAAYFFQRVIAHGRRRAEEMREAAVTVREAGLEPWSAAGTAERQAWMADLADAGLFGKRRGTAVHPPPGLAHRGRPDPRSTSRPRRRTERCRPSRRRPAGSTGARARASRGSGRRPARWTRTATCSARARSSPTRPSGSTPPATRARRSSSRCATTSASRATSSCRPPATARTTARWSTRAARAGAGRAAWPPSGSTSPTASCGICTTPACAACASTSSSAWSTSRPATSCAEIAAPHPAARLARRRLLRGARPAAAL